MSMDDPPVMSDVDRFFQGSTSVPSLPYSASFYDSSCFTCESTSEMHKNIEAKFYGAFSSYRRKLDYKYHVHYKKERQWLHDSIIEDIIEGYSQDDDDDDDEASSSCGKYFWLVLTIGAQGAGKSYVVDQLMGQGRLPLMNPIVVEMDEIRRRLPEYMWFLEQVPDRLDELTKKECSYISETLTLAALQQGRNVIFDSVLLDGEWYVDFIDYVRKEHGIFVKIGMIRVDSSMENILERAESLAKETGRSLCKANIQHQLEAIERSIAIVKPVVNEYFEIQNNDDIVASGSWSQFQYAFSVQYEPKSPKLESQKSETTGRRHRGRRSKRGSFVAFLSTEQNYRLEALEFKGAFADIRKTLDYRYHSNYTFERQGLQDRIIQHFLDLALLRDRNGEICTTPTEPWIVFTAGPMGAGKSHTLKTLVQKNRFPLLSFVNVDPDSIRRYLPEFPVYVRMVPEKAGDLTRKEAGFVAEILTLAALQKGKNVLVDGSLRDCRWYELYIDRLRNEYPALRLAILQVTAPKDAVIHGAEERAKSTGRVVPRKLLMETIEQVPRSVERLSPLVDYHATINNPPNVDDIQLQTPGETWETFHKQWLQTCAWIPSQKVVNKIANKLSSASSDS
ncbi:hypothetical protein MPSEU_000891600 [Mayamaea pseudoterrestris]|nr:hypothetical protein MPSEU_000891600 [Mayamaea pseudoterrestris]